MLILLGILFGSAAIGTLSFVLWTAYAARHPQDTRAGLIRVYDLRTGKRVDGGPTWTD